MKWEVSEALTRRRVEALEEIADLLGQGRQGLRGLAEPVNNYGYTKIGNLPTEVEYRHMRELCVAAGEECPVELVLRPMVSVGPLLHWRALVSLMALLGPDQRQYLMRKYSNWDKEERTLGYGAHFQRDRTLRTLQTPSWCDLVEMTQEREGLTLKGASATYCDPETWSARRELEALPEVRKEAVGIYPKRVGDDGVTDGQLVRLQHYLRDPRVVARGEVGSDRSIPWRKWERQERSLKGPWWCTAGGGQGPGTKKGTITQCGNCYEIMYLAA